MRYFPVFLILIFLTTVDGAWAGPATEPSTQPAGQSGERAILLNGQFSYLSPAGWVLAHGSPKPASATYISPRGDGALSLEVLPPDTAVTPQIGAELVRKLREMRRKNNTKMVLEPRLEADERFAIRIHEKFAIGGAVSDELHLYREVGPRAMMLTVNVIVHTDEQVKSIQSTGEDVLLSAAMAKPVRKPAPTPPEDHP